ncbi:MAG: sulfatase-like hydrolase/transferase, partial [Kordiimonadaceae bacterium]|nr:sulfatase-like hydrolase/transferase [Kordiimonadaceae bacterium]
MLKNIILISMMAFLISCAEKEQKPNIIFILADDMGINVPGSYGGSTISTPNIDALAAGGMMLTNSYAGNSVCAPSRASAMTGLHTGHTSVRGNTGGISITDEDYTVAELLQEEGYATGLFGKWGLGDIGTDGIAEKQGFDEMFGYYHQIHAHFYYTDYLWRNSEKIETLNKHDDANSYTHYKIMDEMKDFIRRNKDKPFFAYGSWTIPHTDDLGEPQIPHSDPAYQLYEDKPWTEDEKKYAAMNTLVDSGLGEIKELVEELGIENNTIIIFASDNGGGGEFDDRFDVSGKYKGFKHQFYEGGIKAAGIYYWDGKIAAGSVSDHPNYFADLMPTFADLAGANQRLPEGLDGIS